MKMTDIHSEIQTGIVNYLSIHPEAAASVKGICNQWLTNERYSHNMAEVQTALDALLSRGEIHKRAGTNIYSL